MSEVPWWQTTDSPSQECAFCGTPHDAHLAREASGDVRHRWTNSSGHLESITTPAVSPQSQQVVIAPAPDILLRRLLRDTGLITQEQYDGLFGA